MFKVGDKVRVKASVKRPGYGWGGVRKGDVGIVREVGDPMYVDFPGHLDWWAVEEELELAEMLNLETV